ncbi:hypothetical protein BGZ83_009918 [Gryganskiella cystojenkinii]|nr:hypothetical protein BGZ83_009918 [Gryganskiella cystojenkinii]
MNGGPPAIESEDLEQEESEPEEEEDGTPAIESRDLEQDVSSVSSRQGNSKSRLGPDTVHRYGGYIRSLNIMLPCRLLKDLAASTGGITDLTAALPRLPGGAIHLRRT